MADLLSHGPDREPPRWTSPLGLAVAAVVLLALVLLIHGAVSRSAHRPRRPQVRDRRSRSG